MIRRRPRTRRGVAAIVMVMLLLLMAVMIIGIALSGARDQDLTVRRLETIQSFYAAEAGMNMAIREIIENADEDGDGTIGTISDDGNVNNDPQLGAARVSVTQAVAGGDTTLTSQGRSGNARREIEALLQ